MPRTSSPTRNFNIHRRGDSRIARLCLRYAFVFAGRRGRHPLQQILKFTVGAIHESPALCLQYAFVFAGCRGRRPAPNDDSKTIKNRGTRSLAVPRYVIFKQAWFSCFLFLPQAVCRLHQIAFFQARCSGCKGILQSHRGSYI